MSLPNLRLRPVTEEAFCMARKALPLRFFVGLFGHVVTQFTRRFSDNYRWRGFRLLGIDGMKMTLPCSEALKRSFPPGSNQKGLAKHPQALLVGLVGLLDGVCIAGKLVASKGSEQKCARDLSALLGPGDLLLCDRNFPDYHTLGTVSSRSADFLFHLPANRFLKHARQTTNSGRSDEWYVRLVMPKALRKRYPDLPQAVTARIIHYQIPGYRPSWLITSLLDAQKYPYEQIVGLYHQRWRQETMHREWKYTLAMANLRSESRKGICKEVLVQLTINNVIRWLMAEACREDCRPVDIQFLETKRLILATIPAMATAAPEQLPVLYRQLLAAIRESRILVRPGRCYPRRRNEGKPRNKGHGIIVKPAKLTSEQGDQPC